MVIEITRLDKKKETQNVTKEISKGMKKMLLVTTTYHLQKHGAAAIEQSIYRVFHDLRTLLQQVIS